MSTKSHKKICPNCSKEFIGFRRSKFCCLKCANQVTNARPRTRKLDWKNEEEKRNYFKDYYEKNKLAMDRDIRKKYTRYKSSAKTRGFIFELSLGLFSNLLNGQCRYCGIENAWGVDRVDSNIGYLTENVVSCCKVCNTLKMALTQDDFFRKVEAIYFHSLFKTSVNPSVGGGMVGESPTEALAGLTKQ